MSYKCKLICCLNKQMKLSFISNKLNAVRRIRHSDIPIFIISYNQYTYLKSMIEQLSKYVPLNSIHVLDNNSTYPPLVDYLKSVEQIVHVHRFSKNYGSKHIQNEIPKLTSSDVYIITDPDLEINKHIPSNFIEILLALSETYKSNKVGFALDISNTREDTLFLNKTPKEWESMYWKNRINNHKYELYYADLDTTFCIVNNKNKGKSIRVAGDFTCIHKPWSKNWFAEIPQDELEYYKSSTKSSCWTNTNNNNNLYLLIYK